MSHLSIQWNFVLVRLLAKVRDILLMNDISVILEENYHECVVLDFHDIPVCGFRPSIIHHERYGLRLSGRINYHT